MYVENTNYWVEVVLRQLKGFVPKGEPVHFHICFSMVGGTHDRFHGCSGF